MIWIGYTLQQNCTLIKIQFMEKMRGQLKDIQYVDRNMKRISVEIKKMACYYNQ